MFLCSITFVNFFFIIIYLYTHKIFTLCVMLGRDGQQCQEGRMLYYYVIYIIYVIYCYILSVANILIVKVGHTESPETHHCDSYKKS